MIPFFSQKRENFFLKKNNQKNLNKIFLSGQVLQGPSVHKLEKKLSNLYGKKYSVCVNSCTDALYFSLLSLGITANDEVLVSNFSYVSSASSIVRSGAKPLFVDINNDYNMNLSHAKRLITKRTKAMIYVHLFGKQGDLKKIKKFCNNNNIYLIEDVAQTFGLSNQKNKAGTIGDISCISFDPTKTISAPGSGGAIITNSYKIYNYINKIRYHGKNQKTLEFDYLGFNSQMPSLTAAVLLDKISYNDKWIKRRREIAKYYTENLNKKIIVPEINKHHVFHKYAICVPKRDELKKYLFKNKIQTMIHYKNLLSENPYMRKYVTKNQNFENAKKISRKIISLPIHAFLKNNEVKKIVEVINFFYKKN